MFKAEAFPRKIEEYIELNEQQLLRKNRLIEKLQGLNVPKLGVDGFFQKVFILLQEEIDIQMSWYFPVESTSLQRTVCSLHMARTDSPQIEAERILLDDRLFPSVQNLLKADGNAIRGEAWWTASQLMRHPMYWKRLKPNDLFFSFISLLIDDQRRCIGYLVLWKTKNAGHFSDRDFSLLSDLSPVIGGLLQNLSNGAKIPEKKKEPTKAPARLLNPIQQISGIDDEELYSLIRRRAQPGVLILSEAGKVVYSNQNARNFLEKMVAKPILPNPSAPKETKQSEQEEAERVQKQMPKDEPGLSLPDIVHELYDHFVKSLIRLDENKDKENQSFNLEKPTVNRICIHGGMVYLLRALQLYQHEAGGPRAEIMILVERVSEGVRVDQIGETTKLTPRESEVVQLLLEGKTNKEVAVCIEIGEYTVKDHIKRIMKKLEVTTRAGIVAKVLQSHFPA